MRLKIFTVLLFLFSILKITAQSSYSLELNTKTGSTEKMTRNETELGFGISKKVSSKNTITNTLQYKQTGINYELEKFTLEEDLNRFSSFENNLEIKHDLNEKTSLDISIKPTINFEKNIHFSNLVLLGSLQISHNFNSSNSISVGAQRGMFFGKTAFVPTFSYSNKINQNATIEIGFPNSQVSYSNNNRNTFLIKNNFQGTIYNLDPRNVSDYYNEATKMTYSQMATTIEYMRNIDTYWSINFKGGYGFNNKYYLTNDEGNIKYDFNNNNGYIFNVGIKFKH